MKEIVTRLESLRTLMKSLNLWAYIVPSSDPHASEYIAKHWKEMKWLSGFRGESGTLVVTSTEAYLWTDSRFYLQAEKELEGSTIGLMRASDVDCLTINQWLGKNKPNGNCTIGINPKMYTYVDFQALKTELQKCEIAVHSVDLIRPLWNNRPEIPTTQLYEYAEKYAGESATSKMQRVRDVMSEEKADSYVISALDEIAWLLNIRAADVECNPLFISYLLITPTQCILFADSEKITDKDAQNYLAKIGVTVQPYESIYEFLGTLKGRVMFDGTKLNEALFESISSQAQYINVPSPIQIMKCMKNEVELAGEKQAMIYDAVALTRFFKWLDEELPHNSTLTEWDLMEKLYALRATQPTFVMESFGTIAGFAANGAIVHYAAKKDDCATIQLNNVLLLDSGGQYLEGTTDITRTVWLGDEKQIPANVKHDFTLVLKGHIALARAKFPKGTRGNQLDVLARQFLWSEGILYGHGTGHGVGHFLGCHEGPQGFKTDNNPAPLRLGNVCSDEPGVYRTGEYGIRTENLIVVVPAKNLSPRTTGEEYYEFETITLCFYDTRMIDKSMLTTAEIEWLNNYHSTLYKTIAPLLSADEKQYLETKCQQI